MKRSVILTDRLGPDILLVLTMKRQVLHRDRVQVQRLMGVTGAKWCDFVVYTSKGMSIERIPFDPHFWNSLKVTLKLYYFKHFLATAAREPRA